MPENEIAACVALEKKRTGWWLVWLERSEGKSRDLTSQFVQATTKKSAAASALDKAGEGWAVSEINPAADPSKPRQMTAFVLSQTAIVYGSYIEMDLESMKVGGSPIFIESALPSCFERYYDHAFLERYAEAVQTVAAKFVAKQENAYLACTAEELAGHALLNQAEAFVEMKELCGEIDATMAQEIRAQLEEIRDGAFEDWDVLWLFDARFDGIESSDLGEQLGVANLHPRDWFIPFRGES